MLRRVKARSVFQRASMPGRLYGLPRPSGLLFELPAPSSLERRSLSGRMHCLDCFPFPVELNREIGSPNQPARPKPVIVLLYIRKICRNIRSRTSDLSPSPRSSLFRVMFSQQCEWKA